MKMMIVKAVDATVLVCGSVRLTADDYGVSSIKTQNPQKDKVVQTFRYPENARLQECTPRIKVGDLVPVDGNALLFCMLTFTKEDQ